MRITVAHPALLSESPTEGGIKSTQALVAALVAAGHDCDLVSVPSAPTPSDDQALWRRLDWERHSSYRPPAGTAPGSIHFSLTEPFETLRRVRRTGLARKLTFKDIVSFVRLRRAFMSTVRRRVREFHPDWVLWENGVGSLRQALALSEGRLLVQIKSPALVPFGPFGAPPWFHLTGVDTYRRVPRFMVPSHFMKRYLHQHAGVESCVQPNVSYGKPPFASLADPDGAVTMINPTAAKGVSIFLALARAFPRQSFRAVQTWGIVPEGLAALPNVKVDTSSEDMNRVLAGTKILLVPSMWGEAYGMVNVDAMLRGIPVLYSDDGGVPEAALGLADPVPVTPRVIRRRFLRPALISYPDQDVAPWQKALAALLEDRALYDERARRARELALRHIQNLTLEPLERYLGAGAERVAA